MAVVLREISADAARAVLRGDRPAGIRVADDHPTEFSTGVAACVGRDGQVGPYFVCEAGDDTVVGEIGGAFVEDGTVEIGYAVVPSRWNRGVATAAVAAFVARARRDPAIRCVIAHAPLDRPRSGRVLAKAGFTMTGEVLDGDGERVVRAGRWELPVGSV
jgi:[ribosomal protein S5]-alanine N-acetyltransferase